ncbi:MAG: anti-sigma factor domain-containing protein [Luteolibacter sp.]
MSEDLIQRFEELEAGRILGDLNDAEFLEWQELLNAPPGQTDGSLELVAAAIETEFLQSNDEQLPAGLLAKLNVGKANYIIDDITPAKDKVIPLSSAKDASTTFNPWSSPRLAWGIAALFAILFVVRVMVAEDAAQTVSQPPRLSSSEALAKLQKEATDLYESQFGGLGDYEGMSGKVTWSDGKQEGYMTLTQLPVNNPDAKQYQLWIVDPMRDEKPVDGGVFDIPAGSDTVVVPIRSALAVNQPKAFVITLEQPGGVVVSKQETVVALAGAL